MPPTSARSPRRAFPAAASLRIPVNAPSGFAPVRVGLGVPRLLRALGAACALVLTAQFTLAQSPADLVRVWREEWPATDFSRHAVPLPEIISGGPPRDGIPPVDRPRFLSASAVDWLSPTEPVLVLVQARDARAYPLQILMWHEIVNDTVGERPVVITFCPLCNSALVFERRVRGRTLTFGTTGKLRHSDLVMWDRQTESWWQQMTGSAIVGELTGEHLAPIPAPLLSFAAFRDAYPEGRVLSRETGHQRRYGENPYVAYDHPDNERPFLFRGTPDPRLRPTARVVALEVGGAAKAYSYAVLATQGAVNDTVGGLPVVIWYRPGVRSALDGHALAESKAVGTGLVFDRRVEGRTLSFVVRDGGLVDRETGTIWSPFGEALSGPLKGRTLAPVVHGNPFAFAWFAFRPDSALYEPAGGS